MKRTLVITLLSLLFLTSVASAQVVFNYVRMLGARDITVLSRDWSLFNVYTTWNSIENATSDRGFRQLESLISLHVPPDCDVDLYGLMMEFAGAPIVTGPLYLETSLRYDSDDLVLAFNWDLGEWDIIGFNTSDAWITDDSPLSIAIRDNFDYDAFSASRSIGTVIVIAKVYAYGGGGGGGCEVGDTVSLSWLLLLAPLALVKLRDFKKR